MRGEEGLLLAQQRAELQLSINAQPSAFLVLSILASAMLCVFYILAIHSIRQSREARKVLKDTRRRADAQSSTQNISMARSHCDIRSALTAILGYCDLSPESETTAKDRFDSIRRQACQIIAAVNNILNIRDVADATSPLSRSRMDALSPSAGVLSDAPTTQRPARRFTGRVLLAEDNRDLQQIIKFYLQAAGAEVTIAPDGQLAHDQALFALKEHKPFDLILMDVQMPNSDGCAATILLRGAGYTNPIVALTANATDRERGRCVAAGCNGFLTKPVDQEDFLRTMQRYLQPDVSADSEFAALRESFQAEIPSRIAEIGTAVSADNFSRVANLTHQLMGTAGCYGLTAVCAAATALNAAAERPETRETIRQYFQTLIEQTAPTAMPKAA
jgi:CheY-like chemotaxis protein